MCRSAAAGGRRCPAHAPEARRAARRAKRETAGVTAAGSHAGSEVPVESLDVPRVATPGELVALGLMQAAYAGIAHPTALQRARMALAVAQTQGTPRELAAAEEVVTAAQRPPRSQARRGRERLRRALVTMPDGQALGVTHGDTRATVSYAQRGSEGWYEVRDVDGQVLTDVEVDLAWPGDRARGVRRVLTALDEGQAADRG